MKHTKKTIVFKRQPVPQSRSLKINLRITDSGLETFKELKQRLACKTNSDVFNYIYTMASDSEPKKIINQSKDLKNIFSEKDKQRKTFTINDYILARLRKLAKKCEISTDELVETILFWVNIVFTKKRQEKNAKKYANKDYCLNEIDEIWAKVSGLRYGLELVFKQDYDTGDPENLNTWFAGIEGGLQELEDLVPKLFEQKAAEKS